MSQLLCVADLGHIMSLLVLLQLKIWQISSRDEPKLRWFAVFTPIMTLLKHFISSMKVILGIKQCPNCSVYLIWDTSCRFWCCCQSKTWQISSRAEPKHRWFAVFTPIMTLLKHFISSMKVILGIKQCPNCSV
jgi:aspartyl/asparaginyl beta-hydroxylase (cupin superfamily)